MSLARGRQPLVVQAYLVMIFDGFLTSAQHLSRAKNWCAVGYVIHILSQVTTNFQSGWCRKHTEECGECR